MRAGSCIVGTSLTVESVLLACQSPGKSELTIVYSALFSYTSYIDRLNVNATIETDQEQLSDPATNSPSEFSHPHCPSSGLRIQPVPGPEDDPFELSINACPYIKGLKGN